MEDTDSVRDPVECKIPYVVHGVVINLAMVENKTRSKAYEKAEADEEPKYITSAKEFVPTDTRLAPRNP